MSDYGLTKDRHGNIRNDVPNYQEIKHTLVYMATHNGDGEYSRLPYMNRSFISFSFGDKYIEDFGLVATISGDRLERNGYSEFEDLISEYEVLDGHFYWGTHYTNHELTFDLATDAITLNLLDSFLRWFSPGKVRELILAEHPNRVIKARVANAPELHLLPFELKTVKKIAGLNYNTSTTLYKGEITLTFTMDEPYWYSKINIFGYFDGLMYHDVWIDTNGVELNIFENPDAIKIALEDNIPIAGMIDSSMLLGNNTYADADSEDGAITMPAQDEFNDGLIPPESTPANDPSWDILPLNCRIAEVDEEGIWLWGARIAGTIMSESTGIENFSKNEDQYFYYAGNAPSQPTIQFTLTPTLDADSYIDSPKNSYAALVDKPYNTFSFESLNKKELQFTTPSVYTGYNLVIKIFHEMKSTDSWVDVRKRVRDFVNHPAARAWANKVIDSLVTYETVGDHANDAITNMRYFLGDKYAHPFSSTFEINSKTGRAIGKLKYRTPKIDDTGSFSEDGMIINEPINNETLTEDEKYSQMIHEEDVGDMIRSNYLIIEDLNQPNEDGHIVAWAPTNEITRLHSHIIKHDVEGGLKNVYVKYNNMYL